MAKTKIIFCLFYFFCVGCAPQKKLIRLQKNHPELFNRSEQIFSDTVIKKSSVIDTVFIGQKDTFFIYQGKTTTRIIKNYDTLQVNQITAADTVIHQTRVISQYLTQGRKIKPFLILLSLAVILLVVIQLIKAIKK